MENIIHGSKKCDWVIYAIIILAIYIALFLLSRWLSYASDIERAQNTGPLGDTLGGLISPIIGLFSFVLVYKTFKAQREQLADQIRATNFAGSSLYFNEISTMIFDVKSVIANVKYGRFIDEKIGEEAIKAIQDDLHNDLPDEFFQKGQPLLLVLNEQLSRIALIAEVGNSIEDNYLKELFKDKFENEVSDLIKQVISVFDSLRRSLKAMQTDNNDRQDNRNHVPWMASQYESYLKSMSILNKRGIVTRGDFTTHNDNIQESKISIEERLSRIDLSSKWSVK